MFCWLRQRGHMISRISAVDLIKFVWFIEEGDIEPICFLNFLERFRGIEKSKNSNVLVGAFSMRWTSHMSKWKESCTGRGIRSQHIGKTIPICYL